MSAQPSTERNTDPEEAQLGPRPITLRVAAYTATAVLALAMLGIAAGPSSGAAPVIMWSTVLIAAAALLGVVFVTQDTPQRLEEQYVQNVQEITQRFERLSARDWLTGLLTRVEFSGAVKMELARSKRYDRAMSIALIEPDTSAIGTADHSEVAKSVVTFVADVSSGVLRESDVLGRSDSSHGVLALLPETDAENAAIAGNRLLSTFTDSSVTLPDGARARLSVKVAIAAYPNDGSNADALISRAKSRLA